MGKSFWKTSVATKRKVTRKGNDENIIAVETWPLLRRYAGVQSSQSLSGSTMSSYGSGLVVSDEAGRNA